MGEIFQRVSASEALGFTGERLTSAVSGQIEAEHYHRYFLARELCRGKDVLDIACGEGYGSAFLAQTARSVIGIDVDRETVDHASRSYQTVRYLVGSALDIPLQDQSIDCAVSFETVEHVLDHRQFLLELKRVLRPGGMLIMSTPDRDLFTRPDGPSHPFHVHELTREEFKGLLSSQFARVALLFQRAMLGSAAILDATSKGEDVALVFEQRGRSLFEKSAGMPRAPYVIAVASDHEITLPKVSLYIESGDAYAQIAHFRTAETAFHDEETRLKAQLADIAERNARLAQTADEFRAGEERLRAEIDRALAEEVRLNAKLAQMTEREARFGEAEVAFHCEEQRLQCELTRTADSCARLRDRYDALQREQSQLSSDLAAVQARGFTAFLRRILTRRS